MPSVLREWVNGLGLRHQGVLMSAVRGCDIAPRHDPSKIAQRLLRGAFLIPHAGRFANPRTYIQYEEDETKWKDIMKAFMGNWDHYPNHYIVHFLHAAEIIGYHAPNDSPIYSERWLDFYRACCVTLHLNPETKEQLDGRLNADDETFMRRQRVMRDPILHMGDTLTDLDYEF